MRRSSGPGRPIHLHGKSAKNRQWRGNGGSFRRPRSRKTHWSYICPEIRDGGADGELLVGEDDEGEEQEQWNTRLRPPEKYDSQDEGAADSQMENGTYHYPFIWDNGTDVKR